MPLRSQREVCYKARDAFFTCCDKNRIENPLMDPDAVKKWCTREKQKFDHDCMASWVHGPSANSY
jgi:cytochrome c oxidase assembly factor 6